MAYGTESFASWETDALALDYPILGGQQIPTSPIKAFWNEVDFAHASATDDITTATDQTNSSFPAYRLYDNEVNLPTRPTMLTGGILGEADQGGGLVRITTDAAHGLTDPGSKVNVTGTANYNGSYFVMAISDATHFDITHSWDGDDGANGDWVVSIWFYYLDFGATGIDADTVAFIGHNFNTLGLTSVILQFADDNTFDTNRVSAANFGAPSSDGRQIDLALFHDRYTTVRYARLKLTGCTSLTVASSISELIIFRRRQLAHNPLNPWDRTGLGDKSAMTDTMGGISFKTTYFRQRFNLKINWREVNDTYVDSIIAFFRETDTAYVFIGQPNTTPNSWHVMIRDFDNLLMPSADWRTRTTTITGVEQGPEDYFLDKGLY